MKFEFEETLDFSKELKRLAKKHKSLKKDITDLKQDLAENPNLGVPIAGGFRKIRLKITSKGQGKSGGARVITKNIIISKSEGKIRMVFIWDKSEIENVNIDLLKRINQGLE